MSPRACHRRPTPNRINNSRAHRNSSRLRGCWNPRSPRRRHVAAFRRHRHKLVCISTGALVFAQVGAAHPSGTPPLVRPRSDERFARVCGITSRRVDRKACAACANPWQGHDDAAHTICNTSQWEPATILTITRRRCEINTWAHPTAMLLQACRLCNEIVWAKRAMHK